MIDLYTSPTPNGHKISCALEAMDLDYNAILVNLMEGEQHKPDFLEISPNGKIPAIIDQENGFKLAESGAILIYLADKTGLLLPTDKEKRFVAVQVKFKKALKKPISLENIKKNPNLRKLPLIRQSRLSVMPIDTKSWQIILKMSNIN